MTYFAENGFLKKKKKLDFVFRSQYLWFCDKDRKLIVNQIYDVSKIAEAANTYFGDSAILPRINESWSTENKFGTITKSLENEIRDYYSLDTMLKKPNT